MKKSSHFHGNHNMNYKLLTSRGIRVRNGILAPEKNTRPNKTLIIIKLLIAIKSCQSSFDGDVSRNLFSIKSDRNIFPKLTLKWIPEALNINCSGVLFRVDETYGKPCFPLNFSS